MDALDRLRRGRGDLLAGCRVAGQRNHVDVRVADQPLADHPARAGHDVEDARREDVGRKLAQAQGADSGVIDAGLSTTVQPAASAGHSFQIAIING